MNTTTYNMEDIVNRLYEQQMQLNEKIAFESAKENGQITEPVLICNKEIKHQLESLLPNRFCILAADVCEKDKIYMVTDKEAINNIRQWLRWMERIKADEDDA